MRCIPGIIVSILLILVSCSPYQKVSSSNFAEYGVQDYEAKQLHYMLKKKKLHYSGKEGQNNYNTYDKNDGSLVNSRSAIIENNIIIPKGARGRCVETSGDQLFIDFGEGIVVPFRVYGNDNSPENMIEVDQRTYDIVINHRTASLYFDVNNLAGSVQ